MSNPALLSLSAGNKFVLFYWTGPRSYIGSKNPPPPPAPPPGGAGGGHGYSPPFRLGFGFRGEFRSRP
jgi:hypothetical protein